MNGRRISYIDSSVVDEEKRRRMMAPIEIENKKLKQSMLKNWRQFTPYITNRTLQRLLKEQREGRNIYTRKLTQKGDDIQPEKPTYEYVEVSVPKETRVTNNAAQTHADDCKIYTSWLEGIKMIFRFGEG